MRRARVSFRGARSIQDIHRRRKSFYRDPGRKVGIGSQRLERGARSHRLYRYQQLRLAVWLEGKDADLFSVEFGDKVPSDFSGADGNRDLFEFAYRVVSARPLPAGTYTTDYNHRDAHFVPCEGYTYRYDWTITVESPEGTLHEAFFDPVTDGTAVAADGTNGVLKSATFTDGDGASATIERIAWESGTVKLEVSPHTSLSGHVLDFIELDGTVSLSLNADQATVDAANDTLSWSVGSQPWDDGDELMLRVRRSTPASAAAQTPAQTSASPLLNGLGDSNAVSAAQACDLMDTPYDTLATLSAPGEERRVEARDSGPDKHMVRTITDPSGTLIVKIEQIIKDRSMYSRRSAPSNPEVYGEWRVVATDLPRSFPLPCLDASSFEEGASGSSDEPHFTSENFLSEQEGAMRNEFWADSTGRPTRARRTFFPPEYDGVSNTETVVAEFTYSGYGEPNIIEAPCANAAPDQADNPDLDSLGLPDCATP